MTYVIHEVYQLTPWLPFDRNLDLGLIKQQLNMTIIKYCYAETCSCSLYLA